VEHVEALRARFGGERVLPATIAVEAEKLSPGCFVQRSPFVNLNLSAAAQPLLDTIVTGLCDLQFTCKFVANEQTLLWSKLCFLAPLALVSSASGMNKGAYYAVAEWKSRLMNSMTEASAVAKASGAEVDPVQIATVFDGLPPGIRSSMQKDVAAGRPIELDAIGGPIVRGGARFGIDVSTTEGLVAAVRKLAAGVGAPAY
jgi:2-dehydropantoate 2-reductase